MCRVFVGNMLTECSVYNLLCMIYTAYWPKSCSHSLTILYNIYATQVPGVCDLVSRAGAGGGPGLQRGAEQPQGALRGHGGQRAVG